MHLWSMQPQSAELSLEARLDLSFYSLLFLAQAIGEADMSGMDIARGVGSPPCRDGRARRGPGCATLLVRYEVIPKEIPG